ncbi:hypothetical protein EMCRGX_G009134 [Ephydatia muelleri]
MVSGNKETFHLTTKCQRRGAKEDTAAGGVCQQWALVTKKTCVATVSIELQSIQSDLTNISAWGVWLALCSSMNQFISPDDICYVRDALLPGKSPDEATDTFKDNITASLSSMATLFNFFIHNLAQHKFLSSSSAPQSLLFLSTSSYSYLVNGEVKSASVTSYYTWFHPETYTLYQIEVVCTDPQLEPSTIFRRYNKFDKLHCKLASCFPKVKLPNLPGKIYTPGKSNSRQISEKRRSGLDEYLKALLSMDPSQILCMLFSLPPSLPPGMVEMVGDAETLRAIQTQHGVTGSFKDTPLADWLRRHNPTDSAYKQALARLNPHCYTCSCMGTLRRNIAQQGETRKLRPKVEAMIASCPAEQLTTTDGTGPLRKEDTGKDINNEGVIDNIMLKRSGHLFHIVFGKSFGNAQIFGSFKRDRAPFVLTPDMAYVINNWDKPMASFQSFVDLCCSAYNELRRHTHLLLSLLSLALCSSMNQLTSPDDIRYVRDALLPGKSPDEATDAFKDNIAASLSSMATLFNFFTHNLAQHKFLSSSSAPQSLLSLSTSSYSYLVDGEVKSASVTSYYTWFHPETYTFSPLYGIIWLSFALQIEVVRTDDPQSEPSTIFRRYSEFDELHCTLRILEYNKRTLILAEVSSFQISEKRRSGLDEYLKALLHGPTHIKDIVYTFLHCHPRDQQDFARMSEEIALQPIVGRAKLDMTYENGSLLLVVRHIRIVPPSEGSEPPDLYVKARLLPDVDKSTRMKGKVIKKTFNPTFNERFAYKVSEEELPKRTLQLVVFASSGALVTKKTCVATVSIELQSIQGDLTTISGVSGWYDLQKPAWTR